MADFIAAFLASAAGAMGLGGGGILLMYLTAFANVPQLQAQGINLCFFLPVAAVGLVFHIKNGYVKWRSALAAGAAGLLGVPLGFWLAGIVGEGALRTVFALMLLGLGAKELFGKAEK